MKFAKLALAAMLVMTAVVGVGCSSSSSEKTTTASTDTAKKEDPEKVKNAVFAAALIAENQLADQFEERKGLEGDKEVSFMVPKKEKTEDAVKFLSSKYWSEELAKKEYEALLGDKALLEKANKAFEAKTNADNAKAKTEDAKKKFTPVTVVADAAKIGANALTGAKLADAKVEEKDGKWTIEYKGLKYTVEKKDSSYKVVGKEGKLTK
jgi:hypothetical protein